MPLKPRSPLITWVIVAVVFIVLLAGAIVLGLRAERRYGNSFFQMLPKSITGKWAGNSSQATVEKKAEPQIANLTPTEIPSPPPTEIPPPPDRETIGSEYILTFSNIRKVTREDITGLTPWELKVARNEIYARYGRPFVHKDLSCYFVGQPWYSIDPTYTENKLSSLEQTNAVFILNYEREINSPLLDKDSGCE